MKAKYPLRVHADPQVPVWQMPIPIVFFGDCLCWPNSANGTPEASSDDLRKAIARSAGQYVPNKHLASFGVGAVILATDGLFWITPEWKVEPLPIADESKARKVISRW